MPNFSSRTPQTRPNRRGGRSETNNNAPLFLFQVATDRDGHDNGSTAVGSSGRPSSKRQVKAVARFDPSLSQFGNYRTQRCKVGHGFDCPRCSAACSYASRVCGECGLECYYEAGVGVVTLKDRRANDADSDLTQRRRILATSNGVGGGGEPAGGTLVPKSRSAATKGNDKKSNTQSDEDHAKTMEQPADGFPTGWTTRQFPRNRSSKNQGHHRKQRSKQHYDRYWYSPKEKYKFRYKYEARRFLGILESASSDGGDEVGAMLSFKKDSKGPRRSGKGDVTGAAHGGGAPSDHCKMSEPGQKDCNNRINNKGTKTNDNEEIGASSPLVQVQLYGSELPTAATAPLLGDTDTIASTTNDDTKSLEQQLREARIQISAMTDRLSAVLGDKAGLVDELQSAQEVARKQAAKISELESYIESSLNVPNSKMGVEKGSMRVTSAKWADDSSRSELASPDTHGIVTEISLEDTVDRLQEQNRGLTDDLEASKCHTNKLSFQLEGSGRKLLQSKDELKKVSNENARLRSELADLETKYEEAQKLWNENSISSNEKITNLTTQVSKLTGEREKLLKQLEVVTLKPMSVSESVPAELTAQELPSASEESVLALPKNRVNEGRRRKKLNTTPLFAFHAAYEDSSSSSSSSRNNNNPGIPKRRRKCVNRFDPLQFTGKQRQASCKVGHGFNCPGCTSVCSYDSRACDACGLECYYEAGIGVVILKDRCSS